MSKLIQLQNRINELEKLADEVSDLAEKLNNEGKNQPQLAIKGQAWYRGARQLLVEQNFSGLKDFEGCYKYYWESPIPKRSFMDIEQYLNLDGRVSNPSHYNLFLRLFQKARSLLLSLVDEVLSRELPVKTELSYQVAADEFETAQEMLDEGKNHEVFIRASGVIARVALERHLFTVADTKSIQIIVNPPTKKKATADDVITTLAKHGIINQIQRSELDSLFTIANHCAHPNDPVKFDDVQRLIKDGKKLASMIV